MSLTECRHQFRQMNGDVVAIVYHGPDRQDEARQSMSNLVSFFEGIENRFSRFRAESELSALNAAVGTWFSASHGLFQICDLALGYAVSTGGIFDPTILRALEAAGYDRSFERVRDQDQSTVVENRPTSYRDVRLDREREAIFLPPGVGIDLGGIAKGWAVDRGTRFLRRFSDGALSAGGDIVVWGSPPGRDYWLVGVENPNHPEDDLLQLRVRAAAVATSGTRRRRWLRAGEREHHLIDPFTQRSARSDLSAVTVVAPTAVEADVHAKVALIQGLARGAAYLEARNDLAGVLVAASGAIEVTSLLQPNVEWPGVH